jgi:hypothetical protein
LHFEDAADFFDQTGEHFSRMAMNAREANAAAAQAITISGKRGSR